MFSLKDCFKQMDITNTCNFDFLINKISSLTENQKESFNSVYKLPDQYKSTDYEKGQYNEWPV